MGIFPGLIFELIPIFSEILKCQLSVNVPIVFRLESHLEEQNFLELDDVSILDRQCYQDYFQIKVRLFLLLFEYR